MLKITSSLLGEDYNLLKNADTNSKKKANNLASLLIIPVSLWFLAGYIGALEYTRATNAIALITGGTLALFIFLIDRAILGTDGGKTIRSFRWILAIIAALINSATLDGIIYQKDISPIAQRIQHENWESIIQYTMAPQDTIIKQQIARVRGLEINWKHQEEIWAEEMQGGGSGRIGSGPISDLLHSSVKKKEAQYNSAQDLLIQLQIDQMDNLEEFRERNSEPGFLTHMEAMLKLMRKKPSALIFCVLIFCFFSLIEMLPVLIKIYGKKSGYEALISYKSEQYKSSVQSKSHFMRQKEDRLRKFGIAEIEASKYLYQ
ncbi:MAG: hypothetical protein ACI857_003183 [Arenicella sp.]|jgi:hypothetical protein